MKWNLAGAAILGGVLAAGCGMSSPTRPTGAVRGTGATAVVADEDSPSCELALHAILREAGSTAVVGQVQLRLTPGESGDDPQVSYRGAFGPTDGLNFTSLETSLLSRLPSQLPTWTDVQKSDPGTPFSEMLHFGGSTPIAPALVRAVIADPSAFKVVVSALGTFGGRDAEGLVAPVTREPQSLRDRYRVCFGA